MTSTQLLDSAAHCSEKLLSSSDPLLKLAGLKTLKELVQVKASFALKHQKMIIESFDSQDISMQRNVRF